eukprot:TRINITY_DN80129_c0_g1_i1.p1 TRINITY_DN80129_c0_g1~~TRINITY_DN80129_c0_g1_i1.p1  ORF type:complete len:414 (+),score=80.70 TRINITY_DN80129_c0_g1_i1:88-1329(+)
MAVAKKPSYSWWSFLSYVAIFTFLIVVLRSVMLRAGRSQVKRVQSLQSAAYTHLDIAMEKADLKSEMMRLKAELSSAKGDVREAPSAEVRSEMERIRREMRIDPARDRSSKPAEAAPAFKVNLPNFDDAEATLPPDDPSHENENYWAEQAYQKVNGNRQRAYDRVLAVDLSSRKQEFNKIMKEMEADSELWMSERERKQKYATYGGLRIFNSEDCTGDAMELRIDRSSKFDKCTKTDQGAITVTCNAGMVTFVLYEDHLCEIERDETYRLVFVEYNRLHRGKCGKTMLGTRSLQTTELRLPACGDKVATGKEACQGQGFSQVECAAIGCCRWTTSEDQCMSAVGKKSCVHSRAGEQGDEETEEESRKWADEAYQVVTLDENRQGAYDRIMSVPANKRRKEYEKIKEEVESGTL